MVTNYHVIENADEIEVVLDDGTRIPATLKGTDQKTDLALLEIQTADPCPIWNLEIPTKLRLVTG